MKIIIKICSAICILLILASCERDDLCPEGTPVTPQLVIEFFDADNPTELLAPRNLGIIEEGAETGFAVTGTTIFVPLRTNVDQTRFLFVLNSSDANDNNPENIDQLILDYNRTEDFISKACGFRVSYSNLQEQIFAGDDGFWIENIEVVNPIIENENETHIRIFH